VESVIYIYWFSSPYLDVVIFTFVHLHGSNKNVKPYFMLIISV